MISIRDPYQPDNEYPPQPGELGGIENPDLGRPHFDTPEAYVDAVTEALADRRRPCRPVTRAELRELALVHPDVAREFWPSPQVCRSLGLPFGLIEQPKPYGDIHRLRTIATLQHDPRFREALAVLLGGEC